MGCIKQEDLARLEQIRKLLELGGLGEPTPVDEPYDGDETDSFRDWTGED